MFRCGHETGATGTIRHSANRAQSARSRRSQTVARRLSAFFTDSDLNPDTMEGQQITERSVKKLISARRIIVKVGTSIVAGSQNNSGTHLLGPLVSSIVSLKRQGRQVVLVSSGAVGLGRRKLGLEEVRLGDIVLRQACAAVGQSLLMNLYEHLFSSYGVKIAQLLLTEDDFLERRRYSNLRHTIERLLKLGVVPIVNENDTVSTAEIAPFDVNGKRVFSDNDRLAALIMSKLEAQALIMLTNVDGLLNDEGSVIPFVTEISTELKTLASGPSAHGRGGMVTKLEAAEIAMRSAGFAVIANGDAPGVLDHILAGEQVGTMFLSEKRLAGKRRWIKYAAGVRGRLIINPGARKAILERKASLLTSGVISIHKNFKAMDVVSIVDHEGHEFARGIANYPSHEAEAMIATSPSSSRTKVKARVLVTRNNIVLND
jgi:glutamate 5-kinase